MADDGALDPQAKRHLRSRAVSSYEHVQDFRICMRDLARVIPRQGGGASVVTLSDVPEHPYRRSYRSALSRRDGELQARLAATFNDRGTESELQVCRLHGITLMFPSQLRGSGRLRSNDLPNCQATR